MNHQSRLGLHRMAEAIQYGENLGDLLTGLSATRQTIAGADLFGGAVSGLMAAYFSIRQAGYTPQSDDAGVQAFLMGTQLGMAADLTQGLNGGDLEALAAQLSAMVGVVAGLRDKVNLRDVLALAHETPVDVRVVSLPERTTTTEVLRDSRTQAITGSRQVETDSA